MCHKEQGRFNSTRLDSDEDVDPSQSWTKRNGWHLNDLHGILQFDFHSFVKVKFWVWASTTMRIFGLFVLFYFTRGFIITNEEGFKRAPVKTDSVTHLRCLWRSFTQHRSQATHPLKSWHNAQEQENIIGDSSQALNSLFQLHPSGQRYYSLGMQRCETWRKGVKCVMIINRTLCTEFMMITRGLSLSRVLRNVQIGPRKWSQHKSL